MVRPMNSFVFILFAVSTIIAVTFAAPPIDPRDGEWHETPRSAYGAAIEQLTQPLKVYFESIGIVVNQLSINRVIYSYGKSIGFDNDQSRNWVQIRLNGQSLYCYVKSYIGIVGYSIVGDTECFPIQSSRFCF